MAITVSILQRKLSYVTKCNPKQPSHFHFVPSLKLSQGEVHDLSEEAQKFSGEVQNDLRGGECAPLHTSPQNPAMMQINHHMTTARKSILK
jgi:hypothetical protein